MCFSVSRLRNAFSSSRNGRRISEKLPTNFVFAQRNSPSTTVPRWSFSANYTAWPVRSVGIKVLPTTSDNRHRTTHTVSSDQITVTSLAARVLELVFILYWSKTFVLFNFVVAFGGFCCCFLLFCFFVFVCVCVCVCCCWVFCFCFKNSLYVGAGAEIRSQIPT